MTTPIRRAGPPLPKAAIKDAAESQPNQELDAELIMLP
jgi:hypothetical protein